MSDTSNISDLELFQRLANDPAGAATRAVNELGKRLFAENPHLRKIEIDMMPDGPWIMVEFEEEYMTIGDSHLSEHEKIIENISGSLFVGKSDDITGYVMTRNQDGRYVSNNDDEVRQ